MNDNQCAEPKTRYQVMLDRETVELARELGDGNLSAGLREAVRQARLLREASKPMPFG